MPGTISQNPPKATTAVTSIANLGFQSNSTEDAANPCFSLLSAWNGTADPPLDTGRYGYAQPMRVYDANGTPQTVTMYFDATSVGTGGQTVYEYVVAQAPEQDGGAATGTTGAGLLMAGTMTFSAAGELVDMSAFSPGGGDYKDLANWTPSPLVDGRPQVALTTADGQQINFSLNVGITGDANAWSNAPASAAAVGATGGSLPSLGTVTRDAMATTALGTASNMEAFRQDGYAIGALNDLYVTDDGKLRASYTNGQEMDLYEIPVFRFRSEDGLYHEGMNHFSYRPEAGAIEYGTAGTENYGKIISHNLETSNVDMAREMVNMIIMQRGFQMNSKSITTSDTMLQRLIDLKR
jgi:flagellar hook protein FlgE